MVLPTTTLLTAPLTKGTNTTLVDELHLPVCPLPGSSTVQLGTDNSVATATGSTKPITMTIGKACKHTSTYTVLDIGEYDVILGRPFQRYMRAIPLDDEVWIQTNHGLDMLPRWVTSPDTNCQLVKLSRRAMLRELQTEKVKDEALVLFPRPQC